MPERVGEFGGIISEYTNCKLPAFFEFAKDKAESQVLDRNQSFVNKIYSYIPNKPIKTTGMKLGKIDKALMMHNPQIKCTPEIAELCDTLSKQYHYMINLQDDESNNLRYVHNKLCAIFNETGYSEEVLSDMLVEYLYGSNKRYKQIVWFCFGQQIVDALKKHVAPLPTRIIECLDCGELVEIDANNKRTCRCKSCQTKRSRLIKTQKQQEYRGVIA